jgi:hypothetical protein
LLFLTSPKDDYLGDSLLHGLRTVLGDAVVDFPKKESLYAGFDTGTAGERYGLGFSLYGLLDDISIDRHDALERARGGEFEAVVVGDVWRSFGLYTQMLPYVRSAGRPMIVVDGFDSEAPFPYAPHFWKTRLWWTLPRATRHGPYFKRELTPLTNTFRSYGLLPPPLNRLRSLKPFRPIAFSIPEEKVVREPPPKDQLLATHVVDKEVAEKLGRTWGDYGTYTFSDEPSYYADLQRSKFGVTTKRAGWDALRHYETAANGCVPAFRRLDRKPRSCAPHGLGAGNCVDYRDAADLMRRVEGMPDDRYAELQAGAIAWARANTTRARAEAFLEELGLG